MLKTVLNTFLVCFIKISMLACTGPDTSGQEFLFSFLESYTIRWKSEPVSVILVTHLDRTVKVAITAVGFYPGGTKTVTKGEYLRIEIDKDIRLREAGISFKSVHILADGEVTVTAFNTEIYSVDGALIFPTDVLGQDYYILTYNQFSSFAVVAPYNSTEVTIRFPAMRAVGIIVAHEGKIYGNDRLLTVNLNRFQTFFCKETNDEGDLTGTRVESNHPIAVVSGNKLSMVPASTFNYATLLKGNLSPVTKAYELKSRDVLWEMQPPEKCTGKLFYTFRVPHRLSNDIYRIMATSEKTQVSIWDTGGEHIYNIWDRQHFLEFSVVSGNTMTIKSNKAITVGIFTGSAMKPLEELGDPAFLMLTPVQLYASDYVFGVVGYTTRKQIHSIAFIIRGDFADGIRLDYKPIKVTWLAVSGSGGFVTGSRDVQTGFHKVYHTDPTKTFLVVASTISTGSASIRLIGQRMTDINRPCKLTETTVGDILDNDCDGLIDEEADNSKDDDGDGRIDEDLATPPIVNGQWTMWTGFLPCSANMSCTKHRSRTCDNPAPSNGGLDCDGNKYEEVTCKGDVKCERCLMGEMKPDGTCECYFNSTFGFWGSDVCGSCLNGYSPPHCKTCAPGWVGVDTCDIPCKHGDLSLSPKLLGYGIIPHVTCMEPVSNSYFKVWLGYSSFLNKDVKIRVGLNNTLTGAMALFRETIFRPGLHKYAFEIRTRKGRQAYWKIVSPSGRQGNTLVINRINRCRPDAVKEKYRRKVVDKIIGSCKCNDGYFGASCTGKCPQANGQVCHNLGQCSITDGRCICMSRATGEDYDFKFYTKGFKPKHFNYSCGLCTKGFWGVDCSTAVRTLPVKGAGFYAVVFTSEIITLDGASLTLVQPGAFRLFQTPEIIMDGFFVPCVGRHDCRSLQEVALRFDNFSLSYAVFGESQATITSSQDIPIQRLFKETRGPLTVERRVHDVLRLSLTHGTKIMLAKVGKDIVLGLTLLKRPKSVTGLLGNADGQWANDVHNSRFSKDVGAEEYGYVNKKYRLTDDTVLTQSKLDEQFGSGGFALWLGRNSNGGQVRAIRFSLMVEFSLELWVKISSVEKKSTVIVSMNTTFGYFVIRVVNKRLTVAWGVHHKTFPTVTVNENEWTYLSVNWNRNLGTLQGYSIAWVKERSSWKLGLVTNLTHKGVYQGINLKSMTNLSVGGGGSDTTMSLEYIRLFDQNRKLSTLIDDCRRYSRKIEPRQRLVILFDEGQGDTFRVYTGSGIVYTGDLGKGVGWPYSSAPMEEILVADPLPPIVLDTEAVKACTKEILKGWFEDNCKNYDSIRQVILENCIRDSNRTRKHSGVRVAGAAFAYYCQGVSKIPECKFYTYLDFCPIPESNRFPIRVILMASVALPVVGVCLGILGYFYSGTNDEEDSTTTRYSRKLSAWSIYDDIDPNI